MRRGRIFIFLILIVVVGLGLLALVWTQLGGNTPAPTPAAFTDVFFAAQNIPQGTTITREMLGTFSIPPENVAEVMLRPEALRRRRGSNRYGCAAVRLRSGYRAH